MANAAAYPISAETAAALERPLFERVIAGSEILTILLTNLT
jgi:hypothetical protein